MASFLEPLSLTKELEGGYVNDPDDLGGETYKGISKRSNGSWEGWEKLDAIKQKRTIENGEKIKDPALEHLVNKRYKEGYWDKIRGDEIINQKFANFLYDFYVTSGGNAVKVLQKILGLKADGSFGPNTLNALNSSEKLDEVYTNFYNKRIEFYKDIVVRKPSQHKFLNGWIKRVKSFHETLVWSAPVVSFDGNDTTLPNSAATQKQAKTELINDIKSSIASQARPNATVKNAVLVCPMKPTPASVKPINSSPNNKSQNCSFSGLIIQKANEIRLNISASPNACTSGELAIVAGYNKRVAKIKCDVTGLTSACNATHKNKVIDFADPNTSKNDSKVEFDAASVYEFSFFPSHPRTQVYRLQAASCKAIVGALITVYPDTYWHFKISSEIEKAELKEIKIEGDFKQDQNSVSFSVSSNKELSYSIKNDSSETQFEGNEDSVKYGYKDDNTTVGFAASEKRVESFYEDKSTQTKSHSSFASNSIGGVQAVQVKDMSYESQGIKAKIDERLRTNINGLFNTIKFIQFIKGLLDTFCAETGSPVKFQLDYPKIDLDAIWQWKEIAGTPKCGFEYKITGGFHPLIGCGVEVDLLGAALLAIPAFGPLVLRILREAENITGDEIKIKLNLNGDLSVDVGVTKLATAEKATINTPDSHVDIVFELTAKLKLKKHRLFIGYGGGIKGSSKITITLNKPIIHAEGIYLPCEFLFAGITLSEIRYVRQGSVWLSKLPDESELIEEKATEVGTWLEGENHSFTVPLI